MARRGDDNLRKTWWLRIIAAIGATVMVVSSASAECAWVLWSRPDAPDPPESWTVVTRVGGRDDCVRELGQRSANWKSDGSRVTFTGDSRIAATSDARVRELMCLPDTLDPRVPRGSGR